MNFAAPDFAILAQNLFANLKTAFGTDSPVDIGVRIVIGYLLIVWLATVIWTVRDVTNRTGNILTQVFSILLIVLLTPILGLPLYLLIRPQTTLAEKYYEDVGLTEDEYLACPDCEGEIREGQRFCPHCGSELLAICPDCGAPKEKEWKFCPECGSDGSAKTGKAEKPVREERRTSKKASRHVESQQAPSSEEAVTNEKKESGSEAAQERSKLSKSTEDTDARSAKPEEKNHEKGRWAGGTIKIISADDIPEAGK